MLRTSEKQTNQHTEVGSSAIGESPTRYTGLYGSSRGWLIAQRAREHEQILVVCKNRRTAEELSSDIQFFVRKRRVAHFAGWETIPFESVSPQSDISGARLATLAALNNNEPIIVVASVDALIQRIIPRHYQQKLQFEIVTGQRFIRQNLAAQFERAGYQKVSLVEEVGEIALHGNVIDFFPALSPYPIRMELKGDSIESLRMFDADTQRSLDKTALGGCQIMPVREAVPLHDLAASTEEMHAAIERIKERGKLLQTPAREIARIMGAVRAGTTFPGMEVLQPIIVGALESPFEQIGSHVHFVVTDDIALRNTSDTLWESICDRETRLSEEHYLVPTKESLFLSPDELEQSIKLYSRSYLDHLDVLTEINPDDKGHIQIRSAANTELTTRLKTKVGTGNALKPLGRFLERVRRDAMSVAIVVGSEQRAERVQRELLELNFDAHISSLSGGDWLHSSHRYPLVILQGYLSAGFQLPTEHLVFISEHEIFSERSYKKSRNPKTSLKRLLGTLALLKEGDYVVHTDYGVGLYRGLKHLEVQENESDFLQIEYADSTLYLPVQQIGKVQKFVAAEGQSPELDKLGSQRWIKTKQKVKESVATLAGDLIKLYATRSIVKGWRFEPYGAEDERFAEEFAYEETSDQRKAIEETLADMAKDQPMDRLVCGDVGFGKTEVALRAAFKCVQHSRQVAVLVPTTILAEQHKNTFISRFEGYPVRIGSVSRFNSPQENKKVLAQLTSGELDIVVGTHRLLSKDVVFKDLGLLIIDEEHRFGVKQKEKLKALKKQVDVVTLTATPIPRTLHMSLLGIRDISLISTPPTDRRVIRSYVAAFDEPLIRDVMLRELQRGGQIFYVHNRVQTIDAVCARLAELVPEARFRFAHGQMSETELEEIMQQFVKREIDVLVSTTIIESGIDVPNANTIIIERADTFGLAQLYQMRGRVGRSNKQAYAYFLIPKSRKLAGEAQQRLKALQALDDLGLGFNLAMRDMEIRGAGNLLGKEQSGSVLAVGFELYSKILKEAILHQKGEEVDLRETIDPEVKLGFNAFIPESYVPDVSERLVLYQRFAATSSIQEMEILLEEVRDRFGTLPRETKNLSEVMQLRSILRDFGVVKAELSSEKYSLSFSPQAPLDIEKLLKLEKEQPKKFRFGKNLSLTMTRTNERIDEPADLIPITEQLLRRISK